MTEIEQQNKLERLNEMFGTYRAEWLNDKIFRFFAVPAYFAELKGNRPCVLQGGRGTGKTTVLRGMSYKGQWALCNNDIKKFDETDYIGIYIRFNTNHTHAFEGEGADKRQWQKIFAHYINLLVCKEILQFVDWHKRLSEHDTELGDRACRQVATILAMNGGIQNQQDLYDELELSMYRLQSAVNSIADGIHIPLSMQSEPINVLTQKLVELPQFEGKMFYIMLDEYENLTDDEQQVMNTYLKHNNKRYTFKIGVRELGWRVKHTLNPDELLTGTADYALIPIEDRFYNNPELFNEFAKQVCEQRIQRLMDGEDKKYSITEAFENLSYEDEAILQKVENTDYFKEVLAYMQEKHIVNDVSPLYLFTLGYWADTHASDIKDVVNEFLTNRNSWDQRYDNYKYHMLFKVSRGRGSGIKKYYAGWNTLLKMANGNIRYVLELVYHAYVSHLMSGKDFNEPITARTQTAAVKDVGQKILQDLEQEAKNGYKLARLVTNIGSFFNQLATDSDNTAPEINQFYIEDALTNEAEEFLKTGVMHMAFVRMQNNKNSGIGSTKDYMYSLHPCFSGYFVYSFRRKRKIVITCEDFLSFTIDQKKMINKVVAKKMKVVSKNESDTFQLTFWDDIKND